MCCSRSRMAVDLTPALQADFAFHTQLGRVTVLASTGISRSQLSAEAYGRSLAHALFRLPQHRYVGLEGVLEMDLERDSDEPLGEWKHATSMSTLVGCDWRLLRLVARAGLHAISWSSAAVQLWAPRQALRSWSGSDWTRRDLPLCGALLRQFGGAVDLGSRDNAI